jgi:hypothetical protein
MTTVEISVRTKADVVRALALATMADQRTVKRWLECDPKVRVTTKLGLEAAAKKLGLSGHVDEIRRELSGHTVESSSFFVHEAAK